MLLRLNCQGTSAPILASRPPCCFQSRKSCVEKRLPFPSACLCDTAQEAPGILERPGFQQDGSNDAEHGGVRANPQRKRENCRNRKAWRLHERPGAVTNILQQFLHRTHLMNDETAQHIDCYTRGGVVQISVLRPTWAALKTSPPSNHSVPLKPR